ncbi:hypothetical protein AO843_07780 [Lysinibacillus sp. ZYM-1]|nr:hypothetical protein AO843_07780 [Lysinibacillus sp. ZYM-1]
MSWLNNKKEAHYGFLFMFLSNIIFYMYDSSLCLPFRVPAEMIKFHECKLSESCPMYAIDDAIFFSKKGTYNSKIKFPPVKMFIQL